jgi:predicted phosphate transport protein (TIGR00153 family)
MVLDRLRRLLVVGERKAFQGIGEILRIAKESNTVMKSMLSGDSGDLKAGQERIRLLEQKSDELCFDIKSNVINGAISPSIQDNLLACIELADDIVDAYHYAAREVNRAANLGLPGGARVRELDETLLDMLELADRALDMVSSMLEVEDSVGEGDFRRGIQKLEEEADNVKDAGFDRLYTLSSSLHYTQFLHYTELLHKFDDILDACEDISDLIVQITSSVSS